MSSHEFKSIEEFVNAIPGKTMAEKILFWTSNKPCDHALPISTGSSANIMGASHESCPKRCLLCFQVFDAHAVKFETHSARGRALDIIEAGIRFMDDEARALCDCHARKIDMEKLYKIKTVVRCLNCGRIAGVIQVATR